MRHAPFSAPVFLKLHSSGNFRAGSPREAVQYLEQHWQGEHTAHYRQARVLCHAAVDGIVEAETARTALIDAAGRAGVLANGREVDGKPTNTTYVSAPELWHLPVSDTDDEDEVTDSDLVGYYRAADIVGDPALSPSRKRALLAYWASDIHAVAGAPGLRSIRGVTVTIDSLLDAMVELDAAIDQGAMVAAEASSGRAL